MYSFKEGLKMSIDFNTTTTLVAMMVLLGVILSVAYQTYKLVKKDKPAS